MTVLYLLANTQLMKLIAVCLSLVTKPMIAWNVLSISVLENSTFFALNEVQIQCDHKYRKRKMYIFHEISYTNNSPSCMFANNYSIDNKAADC